MSFEISSEKFKKNSLKNTLYDSLFILKEKFSVLPTYSNLSTSYYGCISHSIMNYSLKFFLFHISLSETQKNYLYQFLLQKEYIYKWIPNLSEVKKYPRSSLVDKAILLYS